MIESVIRAVALTVVVPTTTLTRSPAAPAETHQLSRDQTAAWNDDELERRDEARTAIRDAVREHGGGELRDAKGTLLEVVLERVR